MDNKFARLIATGFYSGYAPKASGTIGTCVAVIIYILLKWVGFLEVASVGVYLLFLFWITVIGLWASDIIAKTTGQSDPSIVVIDEIVGFFYAVAFLPAKAIYIIPAFFIFRLLDVLKPPPANASQKLPGGLGIMADDIIVGIYTAIILHLFSLI